MSFLIRQLRDANSKLIGLDPTVVTPYRRALVADGFGGYARTGTKMAQPRVRVRIASEARGVPGYAITPAGVGPANSFYVITDYRLPLLEGDELISDGKTYRVGPIHEKRMGGEVYGASATLEEVVNP